MFYKTCVLTFNIIQNIINLEVYVKIIKAVSFLQLA